MMSKVLCIALFLLSFSFSTPALELSPLRAEPYVGDLEVLKEKKAVRILVSADLGFYYIQNGKPKGIISELIHELERHLHKNNKAINIQVIPVARNELIPKLIAGYGDIIVANLTVTNERKELIAFSAPVRENVSEIIVTNGKHSDITTIDELSGLDIWVRESSSYHKSLTKANNYLSIKKKSLINIMFLDEIIQDYEILEMISAGFIDVTVLDQHKTGMWGNIFPDVIFHNQLTVRDNAQIAWGIRKDSPQLEQAVNKFIKQVRIGTLFGNVVNERYLENDKWLKKFLKRENVTRAKELWDIFYLYAQEYQFNHLLMMAQGFQESGLNQNVISHKGAVGIMQILPTTARDRAINISNIYEKEPNIHAGLKYMHYLRKYFFNDEAISESDIIYFCLAAYNAGPGNIRKMRRIAEEKGYDPNVWFDNVEVVTRQYIGMEPIRYVTNINRYFIAYKLLERLNNRRSELEPYLHPPYKRSAIKLYY
ncbi:lytic transglycosylase F [Vibrio campbellii]|uniref:transglycosylase SLT domain-containing protein n=1 Tax=Vibrio campbellii TaxID=680 RepID=UPI001D17C63F|nr:lytic transglycosylase F [Vibrio campbellii]MCC4222408.1 lytic transglycosylase F [Vibrio campbellii]